MRLIGKCSEFGGPDDKTMSKDTGLAFYEAHEADKRPDLFTTADKCVETWKRLRTHAFYIALNIPRGASREWAQSSKWDVMNPKNGLVVRADLVDKGPGCESRVVDCSPGILEAIGAQTDDELIIQEVINEQ